MVYRKHLAYSFDTAINSNNYSGKLPVFINIFISTFDMSK